MLADEKNPAGSAPSTTVKRYDAELVELFGNLPPVKQLDEVDKGLGDCLIQHGGGIRFECEDHDDYTWDLVKGEYKLQHL